ncbi:hypothetical protein BDV29DRAFT_185581 [Aspergillus leporis]|uniref:Amidohydrolase 3 domain-containing protein n=1 Tax=Aspergillus leporis TaxID=41062 RepID=A0A5N5WIY3_9EURO|nr:hypothetical protein BDV29DRAFT_185581 [Aspergillus leporis]
MIDGEIEACATEEPYDKADCGCAHGNTPPLLWEPATLVDAMDAVIHRGGHIGTHAYGDRAVRNLLDVYERLLKRYPHLPQGTLVMEHGGLAIAEQRARAVALGIHVTIRHPLLHYFAGIQEVYRGI